MNGEQRGLLEQDLVSLQQQRDAAFHREAEAVQARSRAKELAYAAEAQAHSAHLDWELLGMRIDETLDALNRLPEQRDAQ